MGLGAYPRIVVFTIRFMESSAATFPLAKRAAERIDGYTVEELGPRSRQHQVSVDAVRFAELLPLAEAMVGWKNRQILVDGVEVSWETVFGFLSCLKRGRGAFDPENWCFTADGSYGFNLFGCQGCFLPMEQPSYWWTFGHFSDNNGRWVVEKDVLETYIRKSLHNLRFCPRLNWRRIAIILHCIPDQIDPWRSEDWMFTSRLGDGSSERILINPQDGSTFLATGVWPATTAPLVRLLESVRELGGAMPEIQISNWVRVGELYRPSRFES